MCTGLRIIAADGSVVVGRTMEFGQNVVKFRKYRSKNIKGISTPDGKLLDGINKAGLVVFVFYFNKYASYGCSRSNKMNVKPTDVAMVLLNKAKTVDDVIAMAPGMNVIQESYPPFVGSPPFHWLVAEPSGRVIVLEPTNEGKLTIYENPKGIFTNSPSFPQHVKEANKVLKNLSAESNPNAISQGTGGVGLPGDSSSISRFIRLAFFEKYLTQSQNKMDAMNSLIHVLNNFDIPKGTVYSVENGKKVYEMTLYTSYYSIQDRMHLYKSYDNQQIRVSK